MNSPHSERGGLPIREVTRLTGVHPVTLRAWERRYGLVVPQRTGKGHRLYSEEQVERIRRILVWLERGVAISQVRALLERPEETPAADVEPPWERLHEQLLDAIAALAERRLDDLFNQAASLYPVATLCERLLQPLLLHLERRWQGQFGARMERAFFFSWLRSKLGARLYHQQRLQQGAPLLLVNQSELSLEPNLWLCSWLLGSGEVPLQVFDWPLPPAELALACERLEARGVLLYASHRLNPEHLPRLLAGVTCPVVLVGPAVEIQREAFETLALAGLLLASTPLEARRLLGERGLLSP
ncbi:TPA: MerR family transcriptional regulator [Pseudomonas aeruginosa]|uniref:MerR family transcriptional regulator n=1 Tax=Pseudomonas aeruginosa TaxID=287 RepID=UPI000F54ABE4|nr:MerR family transcriptional regulator [Pseudomonas aeruginosa]MBU8394866.1 MerR family transcriptional regulator [Pseudomonas aeruginosa]RPM76185.1 helix-turn-helix-type transcriptional regulator [Pseudomonas aeruginosa]RPS04049.1 helix-turn-helix-type transcriptional regulator [Pseudomonas aeruginosa]HCE7029605.1 MerR family transcriptional regulator [Pseudomonas aeruginosa]HCL3575557.1 MerR family transcriptional regulator [Pseudomonas aeruginosa]